MTATSLSPSFIEADEALEFFYVAIRDRSNRFSVREAVGAIIGAALDRLVSELRERSIDAPGPAVTVVHVTVLKNGLKPPRHFRFTRA